MRIIIAEVLCVCLVLGCFHAPQPASVHQAMSWTDFRKPVQAIVPDPSEFTPAVENAWRMLHNAGYDRVAERQLADCTWKAMLILCPVAGGYDERIHKLYRPQHGAPDMPRATFIGFSRRRIHVVSNLTFAGQEPVDVPLLSSEGASEGVLYTLSGATSDGVVDKLSRAFENLSGDVRPAVENPSNDGSVLIMLVVTHGRSTWSTVAVNFVPIDSSRRNANPSDARLETKCEAFAQIIQIAWQMFRGNIETAQR